MSKSGKRLRILLSAYACEPNMGSEPAVGWNWALELTRRGHDVWVLTRKNNQSAIESKKINFDGLGQLKIIYFDFPNWVLRMKKIPGGIYLYYLLWQIGAAHMAKRLHKDYLFDLVHHVTFVSLRQPSFMGSLGMPFILGPVAGGEKAPYKLRKHYSWKAWLVDFLRDVSNAFIRIDPMVRKSLNCAQKVIVTSEQTRDLLPVLCLQNSQVSLAIGLTGQEVEQPHDSFIKEKRNKSEMPIKVLFLGRFLEWKGMGLGLRAFAKLRSVQPNATLTMVGKGPAEKRWKALVSKSGISAGVKWIPWLPRDQIQATISSHEVLLFPSLHDSGGMVVLEAMACGLPVICLGIGGPATVVDEASGFCIPVLGKSEDQVVADITSTLSRLLDKDTYCSMSKAARQRAKKFTWERLVADIYADIESD